MSEPPLVLCMENVNGEEVTMQIEPTDDFHTFLGKAKSLLGYDVDINSIARNQPVSLNDNVYRFLLHTEQSLSDLNDPILPSVNTEDLYILDDGTQIRASQIHFDNEDPQIDLTAEKIPFVKHNDLIDDVDTVEITEFENKVYNIVESPVRFPKDANSLVIPFKLVCNNTSGFEAQFTKFLEANNKTYATLNTVSNRNKSPRSLIRENYKNYDDNYQNHRNTDEFTHYTREDILNMFKDSPVASLPYDNQSFTEKRRHVRKSDPSRLVHKTWNKPISYVDVNGVLIAESESQNCFICNKYVDNNLDKLYLFDNEDQRLHRSSPQKKMSTQLKIICEQCLDEHFKPCRMKSPNQSLNADEYLVIKNNQQYIFQKVTSLNFNAGKKFSNSEMKSSNKSVSTNYFQKEEKSEFVKVEIGSDGEIVTQPLQKDSDDVIIVKDEKKDSSSDVEIIENSPEIDDIIIDNLDDADEDVREFLGKYQCDNNEMTELKCRFCEKVFTAVPDVIEHGDVHKHVLEDGEVYPCPLCDYGYANFKWLTGHLKAAHDKICVSNTENKCDEEKTADDVEISTTETPINVSSPIASRTRSAVKCTSDTKETPEKPEKPEESQDTLQTESKGFVIKTEVKQECLDSSDDEIWIVQTADDEADQQLKILLDAAKNDKNDGFKKHRCDNCSQVFVSAACLSIHKCRRRGRKRKPSKDEAVISVPTKEDFMKRAQGRLRNVEIDSGDNDLLTVRPRKRKNKEPSSDPQIVTCHNCNESFTSKVRLKFHMQFHDTSNMLTACGQYICTECENATFNTETALFDHVHFQHHKQRRWQCPVAGCGKTFYLRATLTKHSRTHTDTRRYVCGTCGKRFLDKQTLDEHGVTHLQIKPFQCHICLKQLTRRSRLRMHLRAHEEELCPRLVLVCAVCARAFRDERDVQEHLTRSPECIEEYANELKEEETVTVQLSPTSGLVRQVVESPVQSSVSTRPSRRCVETGCDSAAAEALLARVADEARAIIRVVEIEKAFRCEYCEDVFYSEDGLNSHRVIHKDVKNPFTCHICKVSFATYSRCTTHKTTHGFYKRSLADVKKQADKSSKQEAGPSSTGILGYGDFPVVKHFLCEDCGRSYLHWTYLQVHRRMKHANENFLYKCNQCDTSFPNSWSLSYHRKKIHGGKTEQEDNSNNKMTKEKEDYRIPCRDCEEVLPNKTALYKHRKKEHSDMSLRSNNKIGNGVFWCGSCGRRYSSRAGLDAHSLSHSHAQHSHSSHPPLSSHAQPVPACAQCARTFPHAAALHAHLKEAHGHSAEFPGAALPPRAPLPAHARDLIAPRAHACHDCGHAFRTLSMLTEHKRVHTGERPFPCDVCGVAFRRSTAMRNHRLIHSGVRAWACARCPKRFRIRSDLRTHLRLKHPARLVVIEVSGLNPTPEEVMARLTANNISHDKVIEITKITFPKGTSSIIPSCSRALDMLSHVPRTQVACSRSRPELPSRRGRGIAKNPRKPKILQRGGDNSTDNMYTINLPICNEQMQQANQPGPSCQQASSSQDQNTYPIALNVTGEDLTELNVQLLLRDGVLVNGNQMVQLQLNDSMLLE